MRRLGGRHFERQLRPQNDHRSPHPRHEPLRTRIRSQIDSNHFYLNTLSSVSHNV